MIKIIVILFLITLKAAQNDVKQVTIDAYVLCTMNFTFNSQVQKYLQDNCTYIVPGATISLQGWQLCYAFCCPGLKKPDSYTIDDVQTCVNTYKSRPSLVIVIGILIGIVLFLVFIIIPCCCRQLIPYQSKDSLYLNIKTYFAKRLAEQQDDEDYELQHPGIITQQKGIQKKDNLNTPGSQYMLKQTPNRISINCIYIDQIPSQQRKCSICKKGKSNLKLNCSHNFHNICLHNKTKTLQRCQDCNSVKIFPAAAYCSICERRYLQLQSVDIENTYICNVCEEI